MPYNRLRQLVLLATNADGEVWLTTPDELEGEYLHNPHKRFPDLPHSELTVYEIAGGAVTGPLSVQPVPAFQGAVEKLVFSYPDGRIAFKIERS